MSQIGLERAAGKRVEAASAVERGAVVLILATVVFGTFFPPESYFAARSFALDAMPAAAEQGPYYGRWGYAAVLGWFAVLALRTPHVLVDGLSRGLLPLLFGFIALASAFWAPDLTGSANRSLRLMILIVFALYLAARFSDREIVALLAAALGIAVVASVFAVIALPQYGLSSLAGYDGAWNGALAHKNTLGALMSTGAVVAGFAFATNATGRMTALALILACVALTLLSRSATALIALAVAMPIGLGLAWIATLRRGEDRLVASAICVLLGGALAYVLSDETEAVLALIGRSGSFTGRDLIWSAVWSVIGERPWLGYGHTFWSYDSPLRITLWQQLGWAPPHAHNLALDLWLQLGLLGLAAAGAIVTVSLWRGARLLYGRITPFGLLWLVLLLQMLVRGVTETTLVEPGVTGMFWLTLIHAALARQVERAKRGG